ncbi:MAG TPA: RES domain-containing protein [Pyrinomonadaceae bacterium]|nr:RES domain-containing protein [Pyrinomonadaceae bacterium]
MAKYSRTKILRLEVQKRLAALNRVNLKQISDRDVERQVRSLLGIGYVTSPLYLNKPTVYRVRANRNVECFNNVQELWYPKPEFVLRRGRCNEANTPVLYCADSDMTAIIEIRPEVGDLLTVLEISLRDAKLQPLVMTVGIHEFTARSNPKYGGTPPDQDEAHQLFLKSEGLVETNPMLDQYLTEVFMQVVGEDNEDAYKLTAAIARIMFDQDEFFYKDGTPAPKPDVHGLAYPSIRADKLGANVAFTTSAADKLYQPVCATLVRVENKVDDTHYTVGILKQSKSIAKDGTIEWMVPKPEEVRLTASAN